MHTLHGLRFEFIAVGGLIEGEFPAPQTSAGLLDDGAREALNRAGLALPPEPRLAEDELWKSVSTRADRALGLWRARLDERGRLAAASYYFPLDQSRRDGRGAGDSAGAYRLAARADHRVQQAVAGRGTVEAASVEGMARRPCRRRRRAAPALLWSRERVRGRLSAGLVPWLTGPGATWSASRLESYRTCAFQFFGQYALRLRELEEEMDSADAATRGSVIHEVLQDSLAPLIEEGRPLTPDTLPDAVRRLREGGPRIWNEAPMKRSFGRAALWRLDAEAVFEQLELLLQREAEIGAEKGVTRIIGAEEKIEASLPLDPPCG